MQKQFISELQELLGKYGAELRAADHWTGYAECGQDIRITAEFDDWRIEDIDLGSFIDQEDYAAKGEKQ